MTIILGYRLAYKRPGSNVFYLDARGNMTPQPSGALFESAEHAQAAWNKAKPNMHPDFVPTIETITKDFR